MELGGTLLQKDLLCTFHLFEAFLNLQTVKNSNAPLNG